jgi:2-methylisocitrate lyase-like PEP mutase family enzyme
MSATVSTFADLHRGDMPFLLPNAWDVPSALLLADAGFPAIATTSLGVTAVAGLPDGVGVGRDQTVALAGQLVPRLAVPLTVDFEGGYDEDPATVAGLVRELADLGVAGINLEDGLEGGQLRTSEHHAAVIEAVASAVPEMFINARTDTYWRSVGAEQERLDETVRRLTAYRDAGASGVFVPGLTDLGAIGYVTDAITLPLNVLWQPGVALSELGTVGVARVSTGSGLYLRGLAAALAAANDALAGRAPSTTTPVGYADLQARLSA